MFSDVHGRNRSSRRRSVSSFAGARALEHLCQGLSSLLREPLHVIVGSDSFAFGVHLVIFGSVSSFTDTFYLCFNSGCQVISNCKKAALHVLCHTSGH